MTFYPWCLHLQIFATVTGESFPLSQSFSCVQWTELCVYQALMLSRCLFKLWYFVIDGHMNDFSLKVKGFRMKVYVWVSINSHFREEIHKRPVQCWFWYSLSLCVFGLVYVCVCLCVRTLGSVLELVLICLRWW